MRRPNHASRFEGIAKTKLQASRASDTETLQSQVNKAAKKRLSLSGLEVLHGRLRSRDRGTDSQRVGTAAEVSAVNSRSSCGSRIYKTGDRTIDGACPSSPQIPFRECNLTLERARCRNPL